MFTKYIDVQQVHIQYLVNPYNLKVSNFEILDFQTPRQVMVDKFRASSYLCHLFFHHYLGTQLGLHSEGVISVLQD